ncbi:MAG: biphenyl 2,3-dioxygenase, partial [Gammaproteobacteria bacterium]|nr:biphenyl 2,3-dioxygenase [Gammaproteobacteria bacterium]
MNASLKILAAAVSGVLLGLPATQAHDRSPIVVFISFGTLENELKVFPRELTLEAGELYQLVVSNPSENKH